MTDWITTGTKLQRSGSYDFILKGFSLTTTEYMSDETPTGTYYDFGYYTVDNGVYYTHYQNGTSTTSSGDNGNSGLTLNTYYLMENIINKFTFTNTTAPCIVPLIRIPVNADYWLNGSCGTASINSYTSPYYITGQVNAQFTAAEYQQAIIDIIYYCYTTWNAYVTDNPDSFPDLSGTTFNPYINGITFSVDLHWNHAAPIGQTSGSYPSISLGGTPVTYSTLSSGQLPLCGVAVDDMSGGSSGLSLIDNTLQFWTSVAETFGINSSASPISNTSAYTYTNGSPTSYFTKSTTTTPLPEELLKNIFFELYNEPFTDRLTYSSGATTYSDNYSVYVNGGNNCIYNGNSYNFTGFGQIYNTIRMAGAHNLCILGGSDSYAYMNFNTDSGNGQWNISTNSINTDTYNCYTTLIDAITNGTVYTDSANPSAGYFPAADVFGILLNLHPYLGLYNGGLKHPGYYDSSYYNSSSTSTSTKTSDIPIPGLAQIFEALQSTNTTFGINCPIICTEYGSYDLPWGGYTLNSTNAASSYIYSSEYFANPGGANTQYILSQGSNTYGVPYYNGKYVNKSGTSIACPAIIGLLMDFAAFNVSFSAWAIRPNSGGNGAIISNNGTYNAESYIVLDSNPSYRSWLQSGGWGAYQPDIVSGSSNAYPIFAPGESSTTPPTAAAPSILPDSSLYFELISSSNQSLTPSMPSIDNNYGANGADFQFIFDNFYLVNYTP